MVMPSRNLLLVLAALLFLAASAPAAQKASPKEDPDIKMGREAHEELLKSGIKIIRDPKLVARVETIGKRIAAVANQTPLTARYGADNRTKFDYKFFIIDEKDVNAFSLPGGFIYINKGLLDYVQSDDELAGVLGHEIIHAHHHHVARLQREQSKLNSQLAIGLLAAVLARVPTEDTFNLMTGLQLLAVQQVNGYGQVAETDADHNGIIVARKAGYNPVGGLTFMERLARDEKLRREVDLGIFRTHPPSRERADAMIAQIKGMNLPINRREVTNAVKATTRDADDEATELLLGEKLLYRSASPERARQAAARINTLLDQDLRIHEVKRDGTTLIARGQTILVADRNDAALSKMASADAVVEQAFTVLRNALFKQIIDGAY